MMEQETINVISSNPTYQFRCLPEEKKFIQEEIAKSGLPPAKFIKTAVEAFSIQGEGADSEAKKALGEADALTTRLNALIRAQLVKAIEMQAQAKKDSEGQQAERMEFDAQQKEMEVTLQKEFERKYKEKESELKYALEKVEGELRFEIEKKERETLVLLEKIEGLDSKYNGLERDYSALKQQHSDSLRVFEVTDDRLMETKRKVIDLEGKLKLQEETIRRNQELSVRCAVLETQMDSLRKEHQLKMEFLEKEIRLELMGEKKKAHLEQNHE